MKEWIENYAALILEKGVNVQPGQPVYIAADTAAEKLVTALCKKAYELKAGYVRVNWSSQQAMHENLLHGSLEMIEAQAAEQGKLLDEMAEKKACFIRIESEDPTLNQDVDPAVLQARTKAIRLNSRSYRKALDFAKLSWTIVCWPSKAWARHIYPTYKSKAALKELESDLIRIMYLNQPDPVASWTRLDEKLKKRLKALNDKNLKALKITTGHGTDLTVELPEGYLFEGGSSRLVNGLSFFANMPTQEVFTVPLKTGINGIAKASMPLIYQGCPIEDLQVVFEKGKATSITGSGNVQALVQAVKETQNADYAGEIALVSQDSSIAQFKRVFFNTLIDENAACHIALGAAYPETLKNGLEMSPKELEVHGLNVSDLHVDFMIGDDQTCIMGIDQDGKGISIMKEGRFEPEFDQ